MQLAFVLWSGHIGGAETVVVTLADYLRRQGIDAGIVFICQPRPLADRLEERGIPYASLGFSRGREVLRDPHKVAFAVSALGRDGTILQSAGLLAAAIRIGGYRPPIVAVEHGDLLQIARASLPAQFRATIKWLSGSRVVDGCVAVSDYMLEEVRRWGHIGRAVRIHNCIDPTVYAPETGTEAGRGGQPLTIAGAGRHIAGKGFEDLIDAVGVVAREHPIRLILAGDGPKRRELEARARHVLRSTEFEFVGWQNAMGAFWRAADVAVVPSSGWIESFGMTALEAMACGKPVIASRNGGLPEVVKDGQTGLLFAPGSVSELTAAIRRYAQNASIRSEHGHAGRERAETRFSAAQAAAEYASFVSAL